MFKFFSFVSGRKYDNLVKKYRALDRRYKRLESLHAQLGDESVQTETRYLQAGNDQKREYDKLAKEHKQLKAKLKEAEKEAAEHKKSYQRAAQAFDNIKAELATQREANLQLQNFLDKFTQFYMEVTKQPKAFVATSDDNRVVSVSQMQFMEEIDMRNKAAIAAKQRKLAGQVAEYLYNEGLIDFGFATDFATSRQVMKAQVHVLKPEKEENT